MGDPASWVLIVMLWTASPPPPHMTYVTKTYSSEAACEMAAKKARAGRPVMAVCVESTNDE